MPVIPNPPVFQPIVEQNICTNGVCEVKSLCREYRYIDGKYKHFMDHQLKACHGVLGWDANGRLEVTRALLDLKDWIAVNCKNPKNAFTQKVFKNIEALDGPSFNRKP